MKNIAPFGIHSITHLIIYCIISMSLTACSENDDLENNHANSNNAPAALLEFTEQSNEQVKMLAGNLKHALMSAMQSGGPQAAVNTCNMQASEITSQLNTDSKLQIKRTSLKYRNPNNQPDAWERSILMQFEQQAAEGIAIQQLVHSDKVTINGQDHFRYMRAIPVQAPCLACHGTEQQIPASVHEVLAQHYPDDQATGYSVGDIRGAFSVWQSID